VRGVATRQRSSTERLEVIAWDELSPYVREMIRTLAPAIRDGLTSKPDLQRATGLSAKALTEGMAAVKAAIVDQCRERIDVLDEQLRTLLE
jgi:hypothetical protein